MFTKTLIASLALAGTLAGASVLTAPIASAAPNWCGHDGQPPCPDKFQGGKPPGGGGQNGGGQNGGGQGGGAQQQGGGGNPPPGNPPPGMPKPHKPPGNAGNNGGIDLNITIGNGGYGGGGGYGNPGWHPHKPPPGYGGGGYGGDYPPPPPPYYGGGYGGRFVTCGMAKQIVRQSGFWNVTTQSCGGPFYSFYGMKKGRAFDIDVSRRGKIVNVDRAY